MIHRPLVKADVADPVVSWRISPGLAQAAFILWAAGLLVFFHHFRFWTPWERFFFFVPHLTGLTASSAWTHLQALCGLLVLTLAGLSAGNILLGLYPIQCGIRTDRALFSLALGWGSFSILMLVLGIFGLWHTALVWGVILAAGGAGVPRLASDFRRGRVELGDVWPWADIFLAAGLVIMAIFNAFGALMPEIFYDALNYHLNLPNLYWLRHGMVATPDSLFAGFPQGQEMLYALGLSFGREQGAHLIHWLCGVATAATVFAFGRRYCGVRAGLWAALLYYSTPQMAINSWRCSVENGWAWLTVLTVYAMARAIEKESSAGWWALAGTLEGLAMGSKYVAWPQCLVLTALAAIFVYREQSGKLQSVFKAAALFLGASLLVVSFWTGRNLLFYKNPIYPFFHEYLQSADPFPDWRALSSANARGLKSVVTTWPGLKSFLLHPWTEITFVNTDVSSNGPLFLLGLPLLALLRPAARSVRFVWAAFAALWLLWSLCSDVPRFFWSAMPLYFVALAAPYEHGFEGRAKRLVHVLLGAAVVANIFWGMIWLKTYDAEGVILGEESESSYLSRTHASYGNPYYPSVEYANAHLPRSARILSFAEMRNHYLRRDYFAHSDHIVHPLVRWAGQSAGPEELREKLAREGITHILFNALEYARLEEPAKHMNELSADGRRVFRQFKERCLKQVFESRQSASWTTLYEVTPCRRQSLPSREA